MSYDDEVNAGNRALAEGRCDQALEHFGRAHMLGRDVRPQHLAAHRGMVKASWRARQPGRCIAHSANWIGAFLFDRGQTQD